MEQKAILQEENQALYVEFRSDAQKVSIYNFQLQKVMCEGDVLTITGDASVHLAFPKSVVLGSGDDVIILRKIPRREARQMILDYITEHRGVKTSELILELGLDVDLVLEILSELQEDEIEPVDIE